jgi:hypothetical protein
VPCIHDANMVMNVAFSLLADHCPECYVSDGPLIGFLQNFAGDRLERLMSDH